MFLPGESQGWWGLVGCRLWGRTESDTTERLHFQFSLSCIGERNGNPLQCSCLENPRDGGAWWAAVYGVVQSWTRLKRLSSSSSSSRGLPIPERLVHASLCLYIPRPYIFSLQQYSLIIFEHKEILSTKIYLHLSEFILIKLRFRKTQSSC